MEKIYLVRHNHRRTFKDTRFTTSSKTESLTTQILSGEKSENVGEKPRRFNERMEKSFITINSAMAEAMELLQGIKEEKSAVST